MDKVQIIIMRCRGLDRIPSIVEHLIRRSGEFGGESSCVIEIPLSIDAKRFGNEIVRFLGSSGSKTTPISLSNCCSQTSDNHGYFIADIKTGIS